jgi:hypothetical protein
MTGVNSTHAVDSGTTEILRNTLVIELGRTSTSEDDLPLSHGGLILHK